MKKEYKYDAFISYRHTDLDKFVAEKIHKYLEEFKLQKSVLKDNKTSKTRINRVFRDKEELTITNNLEDPIIQALKDSEYLIVICSPRTKESVWCRKEIEKFIEFHGRNKILTVLIEGEPHESFPDELLYEEVVEKDTNNIIRKEIEPLAADIRAENKKKMCKLLKTELLRVIAPMFGLEYDDLRQRHRERRIKRIITASIISAAICLTIGIAGVFTALVIKNQSEQIKKHNEELLYTQAHNLAEKSLDNLQQDDREEAVSLAVQSLTEYNGMKLPYTSLGEYSLIESLGVYDIGDTIRALRQFETDSNILNVKVNESREKLLALDTVGKAYVWDIDTGKLLYNTRDEYKIEDVKFVGDNKIVYINELKKVVLYDVEESGIIWEMENPDVVEVNTDNEGNYIVINGFDRVWVYETESFSCIYEDSVSESGNVCDNAVITDEWFVYLKSNYATVEIKIVNLLDTSIEIKVNSEHSVLEDALYENGKMYILASLGLNNDDEISSEIIGIDVSTHNVVWKKDLENTMADNMRIEEYLDDKKLISSSYDKLIMMNCDTGNVEFEQTITTGIVNYTKIVDGKCFVFDSDGTYICVDIQEKNCYQMEYFFDCNIDKIAGFFTCTQGFLVYSDEDNRVVLYYFIENEDKVEYENDEDLTYYESEEEDNPQEKAKDLGAVNSKLARTVLYSKDRSVAFVSYENNIMEIYNVKEKKLISTIENIKDSANRYLGEDKEGNIYVAGDLYGYCFDREYNLAACIKFLLEVDKENNTIIVSGQDNVNWKYPIYTVDELIEKAKEVSGQ